MDLREPLMRDTVADVGYHKLVSVEPRATVREAISTMQRHRIGCLLIVEGGALRAVFTERDLLRRVLSEASRLDDPVMDHSTPNPVTVCCDEAIGGVMVRMSQGRFRHLPVVDASGRPMGFLSMKRVVRFVAECMPETVYNLPPEPLRYPSTVEGA